MIRYKKTFSDYVFDVIVAIFVIIVVVVTLYPLVYVVSMAISDPLRAARGEVLLFPKGFSLEALKSVLSDEAVPTYYYNTLWYTVVGTVLGVIVTALAAYPLSRPEFRARNVLMRMITITMFFSGGLIPTYIVVTRFLHLYDSRWAIILPTLTSAWYVIVARSYFESLPGEVIESARLDGASEFRIFGQLALPLSKPILAVLALYFAVGYWNSYFPALLYLSKKELQPLAVYVRTVVINSSYTNVANYATQINAEALLSMLQLKYAVIVVSILPMLLIYPFVSKYLERGLMIGAVKG